MINNNQLKRHTNPKIKWNSLKSDILIVITFNTLDFPEKYQQVIMFLRVQFLLHITSAKSLSQEDTMQIRYKKEGEGVAILKSDLTLHLLSWGNTIRHCK